jgi:hypothetical protein
VCFSATASFAAAGVLAGIGAATLTRSVAPPLRMMAAVPLMFSAQQAAEGVVWLTLDEPGAVSHAAIVVFLGFALVVWPAWLPAALRLAEQDPRRRRVLAALSWIGLATAAVCAVLLAMWRPSARVAGHHIAYDFTVGLHQQSPLPLLVYVVATVVPFFVSTASLARVIGVVLAGALVVTFVAQRSALTSVWCFFAALLSGLILAMVAREPTRVRVPSRVP